MVYISQRIRAQQQQREADRARTSPSAEIGEDFASVLTTQLRESMRRFLELESGLTEHPLGMTKENRKEYIDNVLLTKVSRRLPRF